MRECLAGLRTQTASRDLFEVVVVDDGSRSDPSALLQPFRATLDLRLVRLPHQGAAAARNAAIALAASPLLILGEDDLRPLPSLVEYCLAFHAAHPGEADAVLLYFTPDPRLSSNPVLHYAMGHKRLLAHFPPRDGVHSWPYFWGGALSCKKSLFRHGEFDPGFVWIEDTELGFRLAERLELRIHFERLPMATFIRDLDLSQVLWREYGKAYYSFRLLAAFPGDERLRALTSGHPESYGNPEASIVSADKLERLLSGVGQIERSLRGRNPRFAFGEEKGRFEMLYRLYDVAVAHAQASGWRDAREKRPAAGPLGRSGARAPREARSAPPAPAASGLREDPRVREIAPKDLRRLEALLDRVRQRLGREPSLLDWDTGLALERRLPHRTVATPPCPTRDLPYLDSSLDVVVTRGTARLVEARRVAHAAVVATGGRTGTLRVLWQRRTREPVAPARPVRPRRPGTRRALICVPTPPEYDRASGSQRTLDLATLLREDGWDVAMLAQRPHVFERYARALGARGVLLRLGFDAASDRFVAQGGFDLAVLVYWPTAEAYAGTLRRLSPATRLVVDSVDLHLLRRARERFLPLPGGPPRGLDLEDAAQMAREINVYAMADAVWTVSRKEADLIDDIVGRPIADVVPDLEDKAASPTSSTGRAGILFVANFRHPPNVEAVLRLLRGILPRLSEALRRRHPVFIVGNEPPPDVVRLARAMPGIRLTGWVPSLAPYLEHARVAVAPLSYGAGTKRKVIQALAAGLPVVSTPAGVEGLSLGGGVEVAADDEAFASALAGVLEDDERWARLSREGRRRVAAAHGRRAVRARLREAVTGVLERGPAPAGDLLRIPAQLAPAAAGATPQSEPVPLELAAVLRTGAGRPGPRPDVVVLSIQDWHQTFQRPQQLARQMAAHGHRVLYVQRPDRGGDGAPGIGVAADRILLVRPTIRSSLDFDREGLDDVQVETILHDLARWRGLLGIHDAILRVDFPAWQPVAAELLRRYRWRLVYDHMEDHEDVQWRRPASLGPWIRALFRQSDLVLAPSEELLGAARRGGARRALLVPNGATPEDFAQPSLPPASLRGLRHPILGYIGVITDWFDVEMVAEAARLRSRWTFLLVGRVLDVDVGPLRSLPNVVLAGEQPYSALPSYAQLFDLCLIPHRLRRRTHVAGSVKFFEYLCVGKPVLASRLRWLRPYARRGLVGFARDGSTLVAEAERCLAADGPRSARRRRAEAERHSWARRYEALWPALASSFDRVSIVIPAFDNLEGTRRCLESLFQYTSHPNYEVLVVDNGSRDGTRAFLDRLRGSESRLRVIRHPRNLGFARAANRGLRAARGRFLVLLNNDTLVTPGWLGGLIAHLQDPGVGAVGPVTNHAGNEAQVEVDYPVVDGIAAFAADFTARHVDEALEVDRLSMFCMALPRSVYEEIGPLDERFSVGMFEDDDYARRVRATGRRLLCVSDVFVHHVGHGTFRLLGEGAFERAFQENRRLFEEKWGVPWKQAPRGPHRA